MLKRLNDILFHVIGVVAATCLFTIVVVVSAQVISRYVFSYSIKWTSELTVYLLTWMVFLGCSMGYRSNNIVGLTMVTDRLSKKGQKICEIITTLILMLFFVVTFYTNIPTVQSAAMRTSSIMHINLALVSGAWNVSAAILLLFALEKLMNQVKSLLGMEVEDNVITIEEVSR